MYNCPINHTLWIKDLRSSGCQGGTPNIIKYNKLINYSKIFTTFRQGESITCHIQISWKIQPKPPYCRIGTWNYKHFRVRTVGAVRAKGSNTILQHRIPRTTNKTEASLLFHAHTVTALGLQAGLLAVRGLSASQEFHHMNHKNRLGKAR